MIFLVQFRISTCKFFKDPKLLVLIYSKLHSKSCDYLYKTFVCQKIFFAKAQEAFITV